jgi:hypothetical protein
MNQITVNRLPIEVDKSIPPIHFSTHTLTGFDPIITSVTRAAFRLPA